MSAGDTNGVTVEHSGGFFFTCVLRARQLGICSSTQPKEPYFDEEAVKLGCGVILLCYSLLHLRWHSLPGSDLICIALNLRMQALLRCQCDGSLCNAYRKRQRGLQAKW